MNINIFIITGLSVLTRFFGIQRPFWKDEFISLSTLSINILHNPLLFGATTNLPLFFYILKLTYFLTGSLDIWLYRFIPVVFSAGTIVLLFFFLKKVLGDKTAWITGLILCFSPLQIYYAQELRPYSLVQFLIVLNFVSLYLFLTLKNRKYFLMFVVSTILIIFTHYTGYYFLLAEGLLVSLASLRQRFFDKNYIKALLVFITSGILGIGLLFLMSKNPAFIKSIKLLEIGGDVNILKNPLGELLTTFTRMKEVVSFYYWFGLYYFSVDPVVQFVFKKVILIILFLGPYFVYKERKSKEFIVVASGAFILVVSLSLAYIGEKLGYFPFGGRHVMPYSVFLYVIVAYVLSRLRIWGLILAAFLLLVLISFQFCQLYQIPSELLFLVIPTNIYHSCFLKLF